MAAVSPGVRVREVPSGNVAISGMSTSLAAFVGMATRGAVNEAVMFTSRRDFEQRYGTDPREGELPHQVGQFFINGGRAAYILRVARDDAAAGAPLRQASVTIDDESGTARLRLTAKSAGTAENQLRAIVDFDTAEPDRTFNLTLYREVTLPPDRLQREATETFTNLTMEPTAANYVVAQLSRSALVDAEVLGPPAATDGLSISGRRFADLATANAALSAAAGAGGGSFRMAIGGDAPVLVHVAAGDAVSDLNATLAATFPGRVGVSFDSGHIVFASTNNEDVRISAGGADDVSAELELGLPAGIEIGAWAAARPTPNGLVHPRYDDGGGWDPLSALGGTAGTRPANVEIAGPNPTYRVPAFAPTFPGSGTTMDVIDAGDDPGYGTVRQHLSTLGTQLAGPAGEWSSVVHGNRLVLRPSSAVPLDGYDHRLVETAGPTDLSTSEVGIYRFDTPALFANSAHSATPGADGAPPDLAAYTAAFDALERVPAFNLLLLPRSRSQDESRQMAWGVASALCQRKRALLLVDPPSTWVDRTTALGGVPRLRAGTVKDHCAIYWPRVRIGSGETIDASGTLAGVMARTDAARGVWYPPAGDVGALSNVLGVSVALTDTENGFLNEQAINAIRFFPQGVVAWGARTMDGFDNSGNTDYRYVNVRRLALFLASSLESGLRFAVFKPNNEELWAQIRSSARSFMRQQWRRGAFKGLSEDEAFYVRCDDETTTQLDIDLGYVNVEVGFAPVKPAEFVEVTLRQMAGQAQA